MSVRELTEDNWDDVVVASPHPVLVDIWAPWCVPCRRVAPMVEELATEFAERLVVGTLNGDDAPRIMSRHEVLSLPTLLVFVDGEPADLATVVAPGSIVHVIPAVSGGAAMCEGH